LESVTLPSGLGLVTDLIFLAIFSTGGNTNCATVAIGDPAQPINA